MRGKTRYGALAGVLALGAGLLLAPSASASEQSPTGCPPDTWYKVTQVKLSYEAVGNTAGKYNSSGSNAILRYDLTTTKSKTTGWEFSGGGSLSWGIGQVEAKTSYNVQWSTTTGVTVANTINVPGHSYGYTTPKIERRRFVIDKYQDTASCGARFLYTMGTLNAITAFPFFSECTARSACTPKP
ncbi:hypothetical protein [Yinghuangia seranimata]|uniref:hypothetical protein n=1 Tax=Yinghuangia seranimata TaxID=408067 RepID=UPI00248B5F78|nr:hypothetical protein [Yinghuangia seranimata]MDI2129187.1 hypothetical protein [Yinghuangia seranimata]